MKSFKQFHEPQPIVEETQSSFINAGDYLIQLQEDLRKSNPFGKKIEVVGEFIMYDGKFLDV